MADAADAAAASTPSAKSEGREVYLGNLPAAVDRSALLELALQVGACAHIRIADLHAWCV